MANYANCRCYRMLPWGPLWYHHCDGYLGCPSPGIFFFHTMALLRHALTGFSIWKNTPKHFMICTIYAPYISIYHLMNPVWYILCSFHVTSIAKSGVLSTPCIPCAPHNSSLLERLDLGVYITTSWDRCVFTASAVPTRNGSKKSNEHKRRWFRVWFWCWFDVGFWQPCSFHMLSFVDQKIRFRAPVSVLLLFESTSVKRKELTSAPDRPWSHLFQLSWLLRHGGGWLTLRVFTRPTWVRGETLPFNVPG